jgi:hypothetical protein
VIVRYLELSQAADSVIAVIPGLPENLDVVGDQPTGPPRQGATNEGFKTEEADDGDRLAAFVDVYMRSLVAHGV